MLERKGSAYIAENYEHYYEEQDAEWRRLGAIDKAANIVASCSGIPHRTILEIGAGDGAILERLAELSFGSQLSAVEISPSGVAAIARRGIPGLVDCRLFGGYEIPYEDKQFDLAVLSHVLEHVEHPRQLLYEAMRVARHVFIEVPLDDIDRAKLDFQFDHVGHINFYSSRTIRWLLQSCGLRVIRQVTTNPSKATYAYQSGRRGIRNYYIKAFLLRFFPRQARRHFSYHEALLCEAAER
jgi:ubiquinone/menaquinone biosynthesis C-methylase UbiE